MSFRKSYTSFDPDTINDKKSFQKLSPFMTGSISFYFLHNNTICVVFVCEYREILCLKIIRTKEMPKRKTCLVVFQQHVGFPTLD